MRARILVGHSSFASVDSAPIEKLTGAGFEVVRNPFGRRLTERELGELLPGVVGLIAGVEPLTRDVLAGSQLRVISRCGSGLSNVDLAAAAELGIAVRSTPDAPTTAVAELTVGAIIAVLRGVAQMDRSLRDGAWSRHMGTQIDGKTVVIVGFGRIGQKVGNLLGAFGARIVAVDPALAPRNGSVPSLSLHETLPRADVVTLHASGGDEILGDREFGLMKPGVFLFNAGRGGLVNEDALCRALDRGIVAGAWLDTFVEEPYTGRLLAYPQVLLTPHAAWATVESRRRMEMEAVDNLLAALRDGALEASV